MNNRLKGYYYEGKALDYLEARGLKLVERNYYSKFGEVDLILLDNGVLVFVEVKYRKNNYYGSSLESVGKRKAKRIYLSAMEYIKKKDYEGLGIRFDLIGIEDKEINWIKNVIWGDDIGF